MQICEEIVYVFAAPRAVFMIVCVFEYVAGNQRYSTPNRPVMMLVDQYVQQAFAGLSFSVSILCKSVRTALGNTLLLVGCLYSLIFFAFLCRNVKWYSIFNELVRSIRQVPYIGLSLQIPVE